MTTFRDDFSADHLNDPEWYQQSGSFPPSGQHEVVNGRCRLRVDVGTQLVLASSKTLSGAQVTVGFDFQGVPTPDASLLAGIILQPQPIDSGAFTMSLAGIVALPQNQISSNATIGSADTVIAGGNIPAGRGLAGFMELQYDRVAKVLITRFRDAEGGEVVASATAIIQEAPDTPLYPAIIVVQTPTAAVSVDDFSASAGSAALPPPPPVTLGEHRAGSGYRFLD